MSETDQEKIARLTAERDEAQAALVTVQTIVKTALVYARSEGSTWDQRRQCVELLDEALSAPPVALAGRVIAKTLRMAAEICEERSRKPFDFEADFADREVATRYHAAAWANARDVFSNLAGRAERGA